VPKIGEEGEREREKERERERESEEIPPSKSMEVTMRLVINAKHKKIL
jgi:hypothetical protein